MRSKVKTHPLVRAAGALALIGSLVGGTTALAQGSSVIQGTITDASTNQPVANVVVTATSPQMQGEQIVVSDKTGTYRVPQLPPGTYTLRFESEQYHPLSRAGIEVRPTQTLRVNVKLLPEAIQGKEVVVVGKSPTIDVTSSVQGQNISQDFIQNIAVSRPGGVGGATRSFESLALTVPGASNDAFGVSLGGATAPENSYVVDGVSVNNTAYGVNGSNLPVDFLDDVTILTGGYMPEYRSAMGGTVSATTKSGGNEFHGSVWVNDAPGFLAHSPKHVQSNRSVLSVDETPVTLGDLGGTLGGYIVKNKLWFFAGLQVVASRYKEHEAITPIVGGTADAPLFATAPAYETNRFSDDRELNYIGKLTYLMGSHARLSLAWTGSIDKSGGNGSYPFGLASENSSRDVAQALLSGDYGALATDNSNNNNNVVLKLASSFLNKRLLFDATLGWHNQYQAALPVDGSTFGDTDPNALINQEQIGWLPRPITDFNTGIPASVLAQCTAPGASCPVDWVTGGPGFVTQEGMNSYQLDLKATYFANALGHHTIKAGFDGNISNYDITEGYTGGRTLSEYDPGIFLTLRGFGKFTGPGTYDVLPYLHSNTKSVVLGGFLQDSWNIMDVVTLNIGLRYDAEQIYDGNGNKALTLSNELSPRVGLVYDPTQEGRSKIYVNYAKFYEDVPLDLANRGLTPQPQNSEELFFSGPNCSPSNPRNTDCDATPVPLDPTWVNPAFIQYAAARDTVDPNIKPPSNVEIVAGGEYEIMSDTSVGLIYTHRSLTGTVEDMSNNNAGTFFLGNPGAGVAAAFPKATRLYNAGTLTVTKRFSNLWLARGSYTISRLHGNYDGLVSRAYGQLDPNLTADFDLSSLLVNGNGPLSTDRTNVIKLYVAKVFPIVAGFSVTLGGSYTGESGEPTNYLGANTYPGYGNDAVYILPRGSGARLGWYHDIDGHLAINYNFTKTLKLSASIDAFNLFNFESVAARDESYTVEPYGVLPIPNGTPADLPTQLKPDPRGATPIQVNPNFGNVAAYQAPRNFRIGVKLTF